MEIELRLGAKSARPLDLASPIDRTGINPPYRDTGILGISLVCDSFRRVQPPRLRETLEVRGSLQAKSAPGILGRGHRDP
jgi:hypothetical protein